MQHHKNLFVFNYAQHTYNLIFQDECRLGVLAAAQNDYKKVGSTKIYLFHTRPLCFYTHRLYGFILFCMFSLAAQTWLSSLPVVNAPCACITIIRDDKSVHDKGDTWPAYNIQTHSIFYQEWSLKERTVEFKI